MELPHIQKIHDKYKDQGLTVLLIQISQTQEDGKKFLEDHNYTMTSLYSEGNWARDNYGVKAAPANFFIDRQGRIIFHSTGYSPGMEKEIESQIKELLEGPSTTRNAIKLLRHVGYPQEIADAADSRIQQTKNDG